MLISYITVEDIGSGLFKTQVLDLLIELSTRYSVTFELIVINSPKKYLNNRLLLKKYQKQLASYSITLKHYPLLPPLRYCCKSLFYLKMVINWIKVILRTATNKNTDLYHCRSYLTTYCIHSISRIPVIFDMRSLWVLENISAGNIKKNTRIHRYWVHIEQENLKKSTYSSAVSKWMIDYSHSHTPTAKMLLIPIQVNTKHFFENKQERISLRKKLNFTNKLVLVYSGSLGLSGINISALISLLKTLRATKVAFKLLIISNESKEKIQYLVEKSTINFKDVTITSPSSIDKVNTWLSVGDIGIHALPKQLDHPSRLGTKIVEYWANGMPAIVNSNIGDAIRYINTINIGFVVTNNNLNDLRSFLENTPHRNKYNSTCDQATKRYFCLSKITKKYFSCYTKAIKK